MKSTRILAAAAVLLASSLGATAAPALEENGSAAPGKSPKPEISRMMIATAKPKNQPAPKPQQVAYHCPYQWHCDFLGRCETWPTCF